MRSVAPRYFALASIAISPIPASPRSSSERMELLERLFGAGTATPAKTLTDS